jgi:hypothetical protein
VRLWDARTGAPLGPLRHEGDLWPLRPVRSSSFVRSVAFSPDGDRVLTARGKTALLWDVSVLSPRNIAGYASLVTGCVADHDGKTRELSREELDERREKLLASDPEWLAAVTNRSKERQHRLLLQQLKSAVEENELTVAHASVRWLPAKEVGKVDTKKMKTPAMQVLVGWFRDGKLDQVGAALRESEETPEAGAGKVLKALQDAIPVLYWETDERLQRLGKELAARAAK